LAVFAHLKEIMDSYLLEVDDNWNFFAAPKSVAYVVIHNASLATKDCLDTSPPFVMEKRAETVAAREADFGIVMKCDAEFYAHDHFASDSDANVQANVHWNETSAADVAVSDALRFFASFLFVAASCFVFYFAKAFVD
jgi:hypothetical protein